MRGLVKRHPFMAAGFLLAVVLTLFFAIRLALGTLYWSTARDATIEGWMPVGYVARSWDVPRALLAEAIGIGVRSEPGRSLARIAEDRGESLEAVVARLTAAIAAHRGGGGD